MPRRRSFQHDELDRRFPTGVAPRAALVELGMSHATVSRLCRPGGPWRRLIPGVVQLTNGTPTRHQLACAALTHAGPGAMITGLEAARLHGVRCLPADARMHVLIPHERRVASRGFAIVERTIHVPEPVRLGGLPVAPLARALIDAARRMDKLGEVRAMITDAVQRGLCEPGDLREVIAESSTIGSALPRRVVAEMQAGVRSAAKAWGRTVVRRSGLPEPEWNVAVYDSDGTLLGVADGWWEEVKMAWEIDSLDWHLDPADYARTVEKHTRLTTAGVVLVHTHPTQLRTHPRAVIRELRSAYKHAHKRPPPTASARLRHPLP